MPQNIPHELRNTRFKVEWFISVQVFRTTETIGFGYFEFVTYQNKLQVYSRFDILTRFKIAFLKVYYIVEQ